MQKWIVGAIVAFAAFNVLWRYAPSAARRKFRTLAAQALRQLGWTRMADRLAQEPSSDACGGCSGCSTDQPSGQIKFSISVDALRRTMRR
jgi:hypothetical protein